MSDSHLPPAAAPPPRRSLPPPDASLVRSGGTVGACTGTRSRVNFFMNKFRTQGFIDYENGSGLTVKRGLLSVVLHD